jgi:hypothetical protein
MSKHCKLEWAATGASGLYRLECCVYLKICLQLLLQSGMLSLHLLERPAASEWDKEWWNRLAQCKRMRCRYRGRVVKCTLPDSCHCSVL